MDIFELLLKQLRKQPVKRQKRQEEMDTSSDGTHQPSVVWTTDEKQLSGQRCLKHQRITPERITSLEPNEVFVFGSSVSGSHTVGASRFATLHFGAIPGIASGRQGRSYAIPTEMANVKEIQQYVDQFIEYARSHPDTLFLVTPVGCGAAGYTPAEIAPLFRSATALQNVCLPRSFWIILRGTRHHEDGRKLS